MDVSTWLRDLGLENYLLAFQANHIDAEVLPRLTAEDLIALGITSIGHRRRLLDAIAVLNQESAPKPRTVATRPLEAERRQLTVLFCDLVGSTELAGRLDPEDMGALIRAYQNAVAGEITRFEGHVAKYMGDGVLAYFGWPRAHEDEAERAVRAGLAINDALAALETAAGRTVAARIGIATGPVVVGELIGEGAAQEQAVVGETPNLAARLQVLAEPSTVVISQATRRLVGGLFALADLGPHRLKGFAEPLSAWQVEGEGRAESRFEALHGEHLTPLVGREHELGILLERWAWAKDGHGQVVLLSGEPGIGKSRMLRALRERLGDEPHTPLSHYCSPHHTNSALYPVIGLLERAARLDRDEPPAAQLTKLEAVLARSSDQLDEVVPLVAALLGVPVGDRYPSLTLTPEMRKRRTLQALIDQLAALAAERPVLALYEDVHWIDPSTLELLDLVIERIRQLPVLALITFRPGFQPPWIDQAHVSTLTLSRLGRRQGADLVARVTSGKQLPDEMVEQIVARTDGVPLFVEELTKTVLESGLLADAGDHYELSAPLPPLAIPTTLHDSLMARLDRLAPVKEVAQIGAVIGREFSHELLAAVVSLSDDQLQDALARLVESELIFRRGVPPNATFSFKHALVRDAAYQSLLRGKRRALHARIAAALEERSPGLAEAEPEVLAHHCTEAGLAEKAAICWHQAGRRALARSAAVEAVAQLTRGLQVLGGVPEDAARDRLELDLQAALGGALIAAKGWGVAETGRAYARARELSERLGDTGRLLPVLWGLTVFHINRAEMPPAVEAAEELLQLAEGRDEIGVRLASHRAASTAFYHFGQLRRARGHQQETLALYDRDRDRSLAYVYVADFRVNALSLLALTLLALGYPDQARASGREALAYARGLAHPHSLGLALWFACDFEGLARDMNALVAHTEAMTALDAEQGVSDRQVSAAVYRECARARLGAEDALAPCRRAIAAHRAAGHIERQAPLMLSLLAEAYREAGRPEEGLKLLEEPLGRIGRTREGWIEAELHRVRGDLLLALLGLAHERAAEAEACYQQALAVARHQGARLWELRAATSLARLWRDQGKRAEARDLLAPVYAWFTEGFDTADLKNAKALLDELA